MYIIREWDLAYGTLTAHDDVIKWKHFPRYRSPVNSPPQRPVLRSFDVFFDLRLNHSIMTSKSLVPTASLCIDNGWRSTTLSLWYKLTLSMANLELCHVHFIRDSYITFIHRVIWPSTKSMELFFSANMTLNLHEIMSRLRLTINTRFASTPTSTRWN